MGSIALEALFKRLSILWKRFNPKLGWLWLLNFSGGKDSSLLLAATIDFLSTKNAGLDRLLVIHEDTSVELPQAQRIAKDMLKWAEEAGTYTLILEAEENFFTLMLRRGYSFPKWNFRWCCRVYKYGRAERLMKSLPYERIVNLLAIRGDEKTRIHGDWIREKKVYGKKVVTASPLIDLNVADVWHLLKSYYEDVYVKLRGLYAAKTDGLGCWTCTVVRKDPATLLLDPRLYELKIELCKARCTSLEKFIDTLKNAVRERPDAFPRFRWPEELRDINCRGKCKGCPIRAAWRTR